MCFGWERGGADHWEIVPGDYTKILGKAGLMKLKSKLSKNTASDTVFQAGFCYGYISTTESGTVTIFLGNRKALQRKVGQGGAVFYLL